MKKRMTRLFLGVLLLLTLPLSVLSVGAMLPEFYGETYYAVLPRMYSRLKEIEEPKILVIGGSNVAFGLDSGLLEELLRDEGYDYTVCPFGLYGAVGTSAMLDLSRDALKAGDIVVLAIEPTSETMSDYFGAEAFWKCAEEAPELIGRLSREKQGMLAGTYLSYLQQRLEIHRSGKLPVSQGVYANSSFNERCDLVYHRPGNLMPVGFDTVLTSGGAGNCSALRSSGGRPALGRSCGTASALGFTLAICLFAGIRERLAVGNMPKWMDGFPGALITAGLMSLAFQGFSGLI